MDIHIVTLFPEFFHSPLRTSLLGKATEAGILRISFHNPRDFTADRHGHVDDAPYGGGPGMVMQAEPVLDALKAIPDPGRTLLMSPAGRSLDHALAAELAKNSRLTLVCGRYEGIDARLSLCFPMEEVRVGDAVLNGGETAALAVIEAVGRLVPGFLGKVASAADETFAEGLLEHPHYTRPPDLHGHAVPEILLGGDHGRIALWRRQTALTATLERRPELLEEAPLTRRDVEFLASCTSLRPARNLSFCLLHHPVFLEEGTIGTSSLTNLDVHDIARVSRTYAMGPFFVATPLEDQRRILDAILAHWTTGPGDRAKALETVRPAASLEEAEDMLAERAGKRPALVGTSARWPDDGVPCLTPRQVRDMCRDGPVMLCLGTARGLAPEVTRRCRGMLRPLRFMNDNHLSVRGAAAILADRILGDCL
ncbi:MAG: tRNA (guanosine(37)-N1)-methyltransferase TrmD [Desulfovibrio sp.]|jgi:tRNA (guanine37-N1)-methyltransferase|nr:tRNA (guanosine(37)-N1)-methyltransferase TrmD [Desulfovibrio sp.]